MESKEIEKKSFGYLETLSKEHEVEKMTFNEEGRSHIHDTYEHCYVLAGSGRIVGANKEEVKEGDYCNISPNTPHWMIPGEKPFQVLIWYGKK